MPTRRPTVPVPPPEIADTASNRRAFFSQATRRRVVTDSAEPRSGGGLRSSVRHARCERGRPQFKARRSVRPLDSGLGLGGLGLGLGVRGRPLRVTLPHWQETIVPCHAGRRAAGPPGAPGPLSDRDTGTWSGRSTLVRASGLRVDPRYTGDRGSNQGARTWRPCVVLVVRVGVLTTTGGVYGSISVGICLSAGTSTAALAVKSP